MKVKLKCGSLFLDATDEGEPKMVRCGCVAEFKLSKDESESGDWVQVCPSCGNDLTNLDAVHLSG